MTGHSLAEFVGAFGIFTVITVTIWQMVASWRAKVQLSREGAYQKLSARRRTASIPANRGEPIRS